MREPKPRRPRGGVVRPLERGEHLFPRGVGDLVRVRGERRPAEVGQALHALEMALRLAMGRESGGLVPEGEYRSVMRALQRLTVATIESHGVRYDIRQPLPQKAYRAFQALGLRPPDRVLRRVTSIERGTV